MKIVGEEEGGSKKTRNIVIISVSVVLVISAVIVVCVLSGVFGHKEQATSTEQEQQKQEAQKDQEAASKIYKDAGIDPDDKDGLEKAKQETSRKIDEALGEDVGKPKEGSEQSERYGSGFSRKEISDVIESSGLGSNKEGSEGGSKKSVSDREGRSSSVTSSRSGEGNEPGKTGKDPDPGGVKPPDDRQGPSVEGDTNHDDNEVKEDDSITDGFDSIDILAAAATIEVQKTMSIIKSSIDKNTKDYETDANHNILKFTLDSIGNGTSGKKTGIDDLTYGQTLGIVQNWLFYDYKEDFSWKMVSSSPHLYKSVLEEKLYRKDFSKVNSQIIDLIQQDTVIDDQYASFYMSFVSGGSAYRGTFAIEDGMPRLIDLRSL